MTEQTPKVFKIKTSPPAFQLILFWPDNIEDQFCYSVVDFHEHGVADRRAHNITVVKVPLRGSSKYPTPSTFTSDVLEPYDTSTRLYLYVET